MRPLPQIGAPRPLPDLPVRKHTLANGLRVQIVERRDLPVVDIDVVVIGGAELDAPAHAGRMSMTAEMLDEGTHTRSAIDIAGDLDYLGAHLNVQATWDAIVTSLHVLSGRLAPALDIFTDVVLNAVFSEDEFRRKRAERLSSLQQDNDEAGIVAAKALSASIFGHEHPYGAPLNGTITSITSLGRAEVVDVYKRQCAAGNALLTVVGDVQTDEIMRVLEAGLGQWRPSAPGVARPDARIGSSQRRLLLIDKPGAAQAEVRVGHPAPARNTEDYFPITVMNAMLGGSFTSRLNTILRERMGVTYGASSRFRMRLHGGVFTAGAAVFTEAAARSAQVFVNEMERMIAEPVTAAELTRAQSYIALGLPRGFESTGDIAAHLREQVVYGLPDDYWATYVDRIFAVTPADVARAAAQHLQPAHASIVVVADREQVQNALEAAGLGDVVVTGVAM